MPVSSSLFSSLFNINDGFFSLLSPHSSLLSPLSSLCYLCSLLFQQHRYWAEQSQSAARERDEREAQMIQDEIDRVEAIEQLEAEDDYKRGVQLRRDEAGIPGTTGGSSGTY